jgi:hypothetical protein
MARIRTIKPETFTSDDVDALSIHARWTWVGLWTHADDEGRARADPRLIKAAVWPIDDSVSAAEVTRHVDEMEQRGMICRYFVAGVAYLHVVNFTKHQRINRPTLSKHPACSRDVHGGLSEDSVSPPAPLPEDSPQEQGTGNREGEQGTGTTSSLVADKPRPTRGTRLPDDFSVSPEMVEWARTECPDVDGKRETERFGDYWRAISGAKGVKTDWPATWRNWMRRAQDNAPGTPGNAVALRNGSKPSTTDQRVADAQALKAKFGGAA